TPRVAGSTPAGIASFQRPKFLRFQRPLAGLQRKANSRFVEQMPINAAVCRRMLHQIPGPIPHSESIV
ncbi:hypothetical protein ACVIGA_000062, partial [Bradyrhizobium sp. USDA 3240]